MEGDSWMEIRNDCQKGMSYTEIARKYHIDPRTAKKYAESDTRPVYSLTESNKVNGNIHDTTNEIPFERQKKEGLNPLSREYIIDKINLRRVQKDCLISYGGNQYSVPSEYAGKDVAVVPLDNMLAAYYEGKQIALHRLSYQKKDMVVNAQHYRRLTMKQSFDIENTLLEGDNVIDFPIKPPSLAVYDNVTEVVRYE